ncbi:MAG: hypothetical protein O3A06_11485 [Proteobacteria bacterium]|nr:hypothetical protein [Pseudomonadota bacterium]MDA0983629.1 hypothetical protein [Pseudomonadota bacterium]
MVLAVVLGLLLLQLRSFSRITMVFLTALTLLLVPALYAAWFRVRKPAATP